MMDYLKFVFSFSFSLIVVGLLVYVSLIPMVKLRLDYNY